MKHTQPLISIIIPVFNAGDYLADALDSILNQTYKNIEIIIVDDASTDASPAIIKEYSKRYKNIQMFRNPTNLGIAASTERAIRNAKGMYLARMDADDISLPNRLKKQLEYLENNPDVVAVGTQCLLIDKENTVIGDKSFPTAASDVYKYIYHFIPLQHPTIMIARARLPKHFVFYNHADRTAEDVELLFKLFRYGKVENLPDHLFAYRLHGKNNSLRQVKKTFYLTLHSRLQAITKYGYRPSLRGIAITLLQTLIVSMFPEKILTSLYLLMKGISTVNSVSLKRTAGAVIRNPLAPLILLLTYFSS